MIMMVASCEGNAENTLSPHSAFFGHRSKAIIPEKGFVRTKTSLFRLADLSQQVHFPKRPRTEDIFTRPKA
jgi:hypothetical protein